MNEVHRKKGSGMSGQGTDKTTGIVIAVCTSPKKGTQKVPVDEIELLEDWGIKEVPTPGSGIAR